MAGLFNIESDMDARILDLATKLRNKSSLPLGGKATKMGVQYPFDVGSEGRAGAQAYDARMNQMESELQDLLVARHGPEKGSIIFQKILPYSGVWSGIKNIEVPTYTPSKY